MKTDPTPQEIRTRAREVRRKWSTEKTYSHHRFIPSPNRILYLDSPIELQDFLLEEEKYAELQPIPPTGGPTEYEYLKKEKKTARRRNNQ